MCRCVLRPCSELNVLSKILSNAAGFLDALRDSVGNSVLKTKPKRLYRIRHRVSSTLGETVEDSRLLSFYIACVKKVSVYN